MHGESVSCLAASRPKHGAMVRGMSLWRAALVFLSAPAFFAAGCNKTDLSPIRDGLVKEAAIVCAPPAARPAHGAKVREVSAADLDAALVALCEAHKPDAKIAAAAAGVLHEALLSERAEVGAARRTNILVPATRAPCDPTFAQVDQEILRAAHLAEYEHHIGEALDRCADVIALARDEDLAGNITDLILANSQIQNAVRTCMPMVEHAPKEAALRFHTSLVVLRGSFPTALDEATSRDHAEVLLARFGAAVPDAPLGCARATKLASGGNAPPETPAKVLATWRSSQEKASPDDLAKYLEAYTLTLGTLDRLISLAEVASK